MLEIVFTTKMKRDVRLMQKRGKDINKLIVILDLLANKILMPENYRDNQLSGNLNDFRECHIEPDWLLIYQISEDNVTLIASGTGTHTDLFE